jgi:hypothetical protein
MRALCQVEVPGFCGTRHRSRRFPIVYRQGGPAVDNGQDSILATASTPTGEEPGHFGVPACSRFMRSYVSAMRPPTQRDSGVIEVGWRKVNTNPERWQRPGSGTIEARGETLWAVIATCGHTYATVRLAAGRDQAEERQGLCSDCWLRVRASAATV